MENKQPIPSGQPTVAASIQLRPYYLAELAGIYKVDVKTFRKWLLPFKKHLGERRGYYFTIPQVRKIFKFLEFPSVLYEDNNQ